MTSTDEKEIVLKLIEERNYNLDRLKAASGAVDVNAMTQAIESLDRVLIAWKQPGHVPLQLCPKCQGSPEKTLGWNEKCSVCNGDGVIPHKIIKS